MKTKAIVLAYLTCACSVLSIPSKEKIGHDSPENGLQGLSLLITITRHGARTPLKLFEGDPNNAYWNEGIGQLTNVGKEQLYSLGQMFRKQYGGFLSNKYMPEEIKIKSTLKDRTIMSAQCYLAGLYPPKGKQVWHHGLAWQPIPVYLLDYNVDKIFYSTIHEANESCSKMYGNAHNAEYEKYKATITAIEEATGVHHGCLTSDFSLLLDTLAVEDFYNLTMPFGLHSLSKSILELRDVDFVRTTTFPAMNSLLNAPLFKEVIQVFEAHRNNNISQKAFAYFMHDVNVLALLSSLTVSELRSPPFAASIIIELYKKRDAYNVKLFYKKSPVWEAEVQNIKGCGTICPLDTFLELVKTVTESPVNVSCPC